MDCGLQSCSLLLRLWRTGIVLGLPPSQPGNDTSFLVAREWGYSQASQPQVAHSAQWEGECSGLTLWLSHWSMEVVAISLSPPTQMYMCIPLFTSKLLPDSHATFFCIIILVPLHWTWWLYMIPRPYAFCSFQHITQRMPKIRSCSLTVPISVVKINIHKVNNRHKAALV